MDKNGCILIADDEVRIVKALKDFLEINNFDVLFAYNGQSAIDVYYKNNNKIDMILLDVMMPIKDGYQVLQEIRENSTVPIIMLTAKSEEYNELLGFNCGADDYIAKPFLPSLLLARVQAVMKRTVKKKDNIVLGNLNIDINKRQVSSNNNIIELTPREFDLLLYLVENREKPLTREQILNCVWGYDFMGDIRTVDTHIKQLRAKLGLCGKYIHTIHTIGYSFEVNDETID
jgi:DNA-binding response OmpR family regulator